MNSVEFERVLQKLLMRLVWNLLEYFNIYIHLDVNSDVNSQPFFMLFCRYHRLELRQLPSKFGGVWLGTSKVNNVKHWANVVTTSAERFSLISQSILNRFTRNFAHTIRSHCGDCPGNLVRLYQVFQKLLMLCTETTVSTSPERWKCGPSLKQHWGSALPPSYMCDWAVRTDKAGRQDWESNYQHYIDIGPTSFFFFFFFKIWYLAENKREKIAFPKYPLLREM